MRPTIGVLFSALVFSGGCSQSADLSAVFDGTAGTWVDLTYAFGEETIYWPTGMPFTHEEVAYGQSEVGYFYSSYNYTANEHGGTHFDAPIHFAEGQRTADEISVDDLVGPAVVVDVADHVYSLEDGAIVDAW